jgi:MscS family membrane protein
MAFMLKEIIDRTDIPQRIEIPDANAVQLDLESNKYPTMFKWMIPNTDIEITRILEGDREGEYLFSAKTISRVSEYYNIVKDLPYKTDKFITRDYYNFYISTPGHLMPPKLTSMIPAWSFKMYYAHTIYQWIAFILAFVITL